MKKVQFLGAALSGALTCLTPVVASAAEYTASVNATSGTRNVSGPTDSQQYTGGSPSPTLKGTSGASENSTATNLNPATGESNSTATAMSGSGVLDVFASAAAKLANGPISVPMAAGATSSSSARFKDSFIVSCAGALACVDGQFGTMTVGFMVQGQAGGSGAITPTGVLSNGGYSGFGQWASSLGITATAPLGPNGTAGAASWAGGQTVRDGSSGGPSVADYNVSFPLASFGLKELTFSFQFGQPVFLDMLAMTGANAGVGYDSSGSSAQASFQASLTPAWGGILHMAGNGGTSLDEIAGVTALSAATGVNYMRSQVAAVPEPGTALMLVSGLTLTTIAAWRRRLRILTRR